MFIPPTSTPTVRSGVTISRVTPERTSISAVVIAECVPSSSYSSTSPLQPGVTADDVPRRDDEVVAGFERRVLWQAHPSRRSRRRVRRSPTTCSSAYVSTCTSTPNRASSLSRHSTMPSRSLRRGLRAARRICPPGPRHRLEQRHVVTTLAAHPGRLQPTRATADDHDTTATGRPGDDVRHRQLTTGGGVVDAQRLTRLVDAIEAVRRTDTRPDRVLDTQLDLADEVRFGHLRTGHADHVDKTFVDRVPSRADVVDLGCVQHGEPASRRAPCRRSRGVVPTACRGSGSPRSAPRR